MVDGMNSWKLVKAARTKFGTHSVGIQEQQQQIQQLQEKIKELENI